MNKFRFILVSGLAATLSVFTLSAQSQSDMRLNELLIHNETNFEDDFGFHNGWFELFNTSYGTVRQHTLFWADNNPYHGTFHINFTLEESDTIYFVASDGRTVIDKIAVPKNLGVDQSYGRIEDGIGSNDGSGEGWAIMPWTSPSTNNAGVDEESKSQIMAREDPGGWILTLTAMLVVFCALIILCFIFKFTGHVATSKQQKKSTAATADTEAAGTIVKETSAETYAAIALALHLFHEESEAHDHESLTITMSHTDRSYSPWSSKIYTLRQTPTLKKNQR